MQATSTGMNRTGAATSPAGTQAMLEASLEMTPPVALDLADMKATRPFGESM